MQLPNRLARSLYKQNSRNNDIYKPLISLIARLICVTIDPMDRRVPRNWVPAIPHAFLVAVVITFVTIASPVAIYSFREPINPSFIFNTIESCVIPIILVDVPVAVPEDIVSVKRLAFWMKSTIPVLFGFKQQNEPQYASLSTQFTHLFTISNRLPLFRPLG